MKLISSILAFIGLLLLLVFGFASWTTVSAGNRGVVTRMGAVQPRVLPEGFSWKTPFTESVHEFSVRESKEQVETEGASKDLQVVKVAVALNFSVDQDKVSEIYRTVGEKYIGVVIDPAMQETVKAIIASYTAEELITKRELVRAAIKSTLSAKLTSHGIIVHEFSIINFNFSKSFNEAIEAKVTAEQSALAAKNKLAQIEYEAQQKVAEAKGKAEAMRVESIALSTSPQILQLRALEKWDGKLPTVSGGAIPFIDVKQFAK